MRMQRIGRFWHQMGLCSLVLIGASLTGVGHSADIVINSAMSAPNGYPTYPFQLGQNQNLTVANGGSLSSSTNSYYGVLGSNSGGNVITVQNGGAISLTGNNATGVKVFTTHGSWSNTTLGCSATPANTIVMDAGSSLNISGQDSSGIYVTYDNLLTINGSITHTGTNSGSYYPAAIRLDNEHNTLNFGGAITTTNSSVYGIYAAPLNNLIRSSGSITTSGSSAHGIYLPGGWSYLSVSGSITTSGANADAVRSSSTGNVFAISGALSATGSGSSALYLRYAAGGGYNVVHLLNGASLTGNIVNDTIDGYSLLTFGYAKSSGDAVLTAADSAFNFTQNGNITATTGANWDGYLAGGSTTLNGSINQFRNLYIGGDCFSSKTMFWNTPVETKIVNIAGATATLNVTNAISTTGAVIVGSGSTYNLSGAHTHTGSSFDIAGTMAVTGSGSLNLGSSPVGLSGTLRNNSSNTINISTLNVASGNTGALEGTGAVATTTANVTGTLNHSNTGANTMNTLNLSGLLNQNAASGSLAVTYLNVTSGNSGTIGGTGAGTLNIANAGLVGALTLNHDANVSGVLSNYGGLTASRNLTLLSTASYHGTGALNFSGGTLTNNAPGVVRLPTLNVNSGSSGTLAGSGSTSVTAANLAGTLNNNASGAVSIATLTVDSGNTGALGGSSATGVTTANVNGTLNHTATTANTIGTANLAGTLNQNSASTLTVTNLNVATGGTGTLGGTGTTNVGTAVVDGTLNTAGSGATTLSTANVSGTVNNTNTGATTISTLTVDNAKTATIGGSSATAITTANVYGTLNNTATAANTIGTTNLAGTVNENSASNLTLTNLNVASGKTGTLGGTGTGTLRANNATVAGTLKFGRAAEVDTLLLSGTAEQEASAASTITTLNVASGNAGTVKESGSGALTVTNLNLNSGSSATLSGSGTGTLTVTNASISNATLNVNRAVTLTNGITSLGSTGQLAGTGTITGNVATGGSGGTVAPGVSASETGTLSVVGNVTINTAGTLALDITTPAADKLSATNAVTFANGSTVRVTGLSTQVGATYQVVSAAGGLTNNGATFDISDNSYMLRFTYALTATAMNVSVALIPDSAKSAIVNDEQSYNIARVIDQLASSQPAGMSGLFNGLFSQSTSGAAHHAISQLGDGNAVSATQQMTMSGVQQSNSALRGQFSSFRTASLASSVLGPIADGAANRDTIRAAAGGVPLDPDSAQLLRQQQLDASAAACPDNKWNGFLKAYGGFGKEGSADVAIGYDFGGAGLLTGLDYSLSQDLRAGWLIDYSYNRANMYASYGNVTDHVIRTGPFGSYNWDNFFFDTAPQVGVHMLETQRNIDFLAETTSGERTGVDLNWLNTTGYRFDLPKEFMLTPSYGLAFTTMYDPGYTETGSAKGANLIVNEYTSYSLLQNLELKLGRVWQVNRKFSFLPEVWGGWEHEYLNGNGDVTTAFAASPSNCWTAPTSAIAADRAVFGAGLSTLLSQRWTVFGRYDHKLWDRGFSTNFSGGVMVAF